MFLFSFALKVNVTRTFDIMTINRELPMAMFNLPVEFEVVRHWRY